MTELDTGSQRYDRLSKEALIRVLQHVPESTIKGAMIYDEYLNSSEWRKGRLWTSKYREIFSQSIYYKDAPRHKIEWLLDAVDLVGRALETSFGPELTFSDIEATVEVAGFFEKQKIRPEDLTRYKNPKNWITETADHHEDHSVYVGPPDLERIVRVHSRFFKTDFRYVLVVMENQGDIAQGKEIFSFRRTEKD
ncbi:MAG TPA: hypothetical protein VJ227_04260 [Patescibacteria group bacterium]|nr:hypothetical protein [Patescibacteria group bacterium]